MQAYKTKSFNKHERMQIICKPHRNVRSKICVEFKWVNW